MIGVSGGLDSTHALIVAAKAFDALGLPRKNILGFTMPGFATSEGTKSNAWALMKALGVTGEEIDIKPAATQMLEDIGHPVREGRAGLRHHVRERAGGAAHRLPVPPRQPAQGLRARHRRPLGARARLVHLRRRRPHEPLQRQRLGREDADPVPRALGGEDEAVRRGGLGDAALDPRHRDLARARAGRRARATMQSTQSKVGPYELQDFHLYYITRYGLRPSKVAFLAWHAWRDAARGAWPPHFPDEAQARLHARRHQEVARRLPVSASSRSASSSARRCRTAPRSSPAATSRRAATGARPRTATRRVWLDELEANVPDE